MITIELGNSYSTIKGLSKAQEVQVRSFLSYTVGGSSAHFSKFGPRKKSLVSKRNEFPTGLLTRLAGYLMDNRIEFKVSDKRLRPKLTNTQLYHYHGPDLRHYQIDAIEAFKREERGIISSATGTGKSLMIAGLVNEMNMRTLVVVPNLELKAQLTATLAETLADTSHIVVENIDSKSLKDHKNFDLLIIDEAHHAASETYQKLNKTVWKDIYYRCFLTATPFRNDKEETLLFEAIAGDCIFELDHMDAVDQGAIVPVEAYYLDVEKQPTDAYTYSQVYSQLVVNNQHRNYLTGVLLGRLNSEQKATLCLVKEIRHGEILSELTGFPFVNGQNFDSRQYIQQFNEGKIKVLIGTTGVLGEGCDTRPCEYVVIATPGKAKSQLMQQIGRSVRLYPGKESAKVIIFRDASHKFLLRHFNAQKKVLVDNYRTSPVKLVL